MASQKKQMALQSAPKSPLKLALTGFDSGWGCRDYGCEDGPYKLKTKSLNRPLAEHQVMVSPVAILGLKKLGKHRDFKTKEDNFHLVYEGLKRLHFKLKQDLKKTHLPVVIGGDHSSAIATWSSIITHHKAEGAFGLIWLDAHLDAHTPETCHEGKWGGWWHGMPVTALCGYGLPAFTKLGGTKAKINPKHMTMIGIRSFEPSEVKFVKKHKIKTAYADDVAAKGFDAIFKTALKRATTGTKGFGISIDLDGFDPKDAPGVGTNEKNGLRAKDVLHTLRGIGHHPLFKGLEIAEFNPHKDKNGKTAQLIHNIILATFARP
jgi:arginase